MKQKRKHIVPYNKAIYDIIWLVFSTSSMKIWNKQFQSQTSISWDGL